MDAVMQRRATETSHQALAAEVARELAKQSVATPAQQIIREHHHYFITQPVPNRSMPSPSMSSDAKWGGKSVHEQFLGQAGSSSTDIPIKYFRRDGPNTAAPIASTEFPDEMMRPQMVKRGNVKQLADKIDNRPAPSGPPRPPVERTGSVKQLKTKFDKPKVEPQGSNLRDIAMKKMMAIADRASQETTKQQSFARKVELDKRKKRGGAPGDVVPLGKRKEPEPDLPRSMLRKPAPARSNTRQRVYGPKTQVFDMSGDGVRAY